MSSQRLCRETHDLPCEEAIPRPNQDGFAIFIARPLPQVPPVLCSVDDLRRELGQTRKRAKDGRVLFHYNGHGCPKATPFGELWFFDRDHTQYVPVPMADIIGCVGSPTVYVLECSNAGAILYHWYGTCLWLQLRGPQFARCVGPPFVWKSSSAAGQCLPQVSPVQIGCMTQTLLTRHVP